jgi:hypothetical protein
MSDQIKNVAGIIIPYSLLCAFLSLYYYWKPFGIQPFEFISISEAIAYGIPFLMFSAFMLVPVFLGEFLWPSKYPENPENESKGGYLQVHVALVGITNLIVVVLAETDHRWPSQSPLFIGLVAAMFPSAFRLGSLDEFAKYIPSKNLRILLFLIICCLPAAAISSAIWSRSGIINQSDYYTVAGSDIKSEKVAGHLTYLGHLGEYIFLIRENSTVAYQLDDLTKLELKKGLAGKQATHLELKNTAASQQNKK